MPGINKTHAMRVLDARRVAYTVKRYDASGEFHSADEAAALLGVAASLVYKTLVVLRDDGSQGKPMLAMIPSTDEVELRALAASVGAKKLRMARLAEAERLTGMQAGGISALALRDPQRFDVLIDERARTLERIHISAGRRGLDLEVAVRDLVVITRAAFVQTN